MILNPNLQALRTTREEAAAGLIAAGLLPNPIFGASADDPYGNGSTGLSTSVGLSLSIDSQQILTCWHRIAAARGEIDRVDLDILWQEWQVSQHARGRLLGLLGQPERSSLVIEPPESISSAPPSAAHRGEALRAGCVDVAGSCRPGRRDSRGGPRRRRRQ